MLSVGKNKNNPLTKEKLRDIRAIRWQKKNNPLTKEKLRDIRVIRWQKQK